MINKNFTFDTFKEDATNRLAFVACKCIFSDLPDCIDIVWLYGPAGRGKTHLLQATENKFKTEHSVYSLDATELEEKYFNFDYKTKKELNEVEAAQLLIIDDLDYLINKTNFQEELAKMILKKVANGHKILLASNCYPKELDVLYKLIIEKTLYADTGFSVEEKYTKMVLDFMKNTSIKIEDDALKLLIEAKLTMPQFIRVLRKIEKYYQNNKVALDYPTIKNFIERIIKFYESL